MKKKTFKRAGAAVLSMAMLLSFGAIGATTAYAAGYTVTIAQTDAVKHYDIFKIATLGSDGKYTLEDAESILALVDSGNNKGFIKVTENLDKDGNTLDDGATTGVAIAKDTTLASITSNSAKAEILAKAIAKAKTNNKEKTVSSQTNEDASTTLPGGYYLVLNNDTNPTPVLISVTDNSNKIYYKYSELPFDKTITAINAAHAEDNVVGNIVGGEHGQKSGSTTPTYAYSEADKTAGTINAKTGIADVGATVSYKIATKTPTYNPDSVKTGSDITDFKITDVPETGINIQFGTAYNAAGQNIAAVGEGGDKVAVNYGDITVTVTGGTAPVAGTDYTITKITTDDDKNKYKNTDASYSLGAIGTLADGFQIKFTDAYIIANQGKDVTVTFNADITADATIDTNSNNNHATLEYSNNYDTGIGDKDNPVDKDTKKPNPDYKSPEETPDEEPEIPIVPDEDVEPKTEEADADVFITTVTLNKFQEDGETALADAKFVLYESDGSTVVKAETATDTNGHIVFKGLGKGSYKLVETKAPAGYTVAAPVDFTVDTSNTAASGFLGNFTYTNTDVTYAAEDTEKANPIYLNTISITDTKGQTLPGTGGMGTILFTVGGAAIVLLAGTMFVIYMKKRKVEE